MARVVRRLGLDTWWARPPGGATSAAFLALRSIVVCYFLSCSEAWASLLGMEHDYGSSPKFVCVPIPPEADPSCYSPPSAHHRPGTNGHAGRILISDEAKATILHLRESLVRQKETILDQRETIRELTAKLTLCEGFGGHHSNGHHNNHHDNHHGNRHDDHRGNHHDGHSSHHASYHGGDHHSSHGTHRSDSHRWESHGKHGSFSPEQTGKTLQTLKERLENLQARNSSSSYSSSLRELLQRKINALEEQLRSYYREHHDDHDDDHRHDDDDHHHDNHRNNHDDHHHDDHYRDNHATDHHDDHRESSHYDHRARHHAPRYDHYDWHSGSRHFARYASHRDEHRDGRHDDVRHDDHHLPRRLPFSGKDTGSHNVGHGKLESVLSQLHHGHSEHGGPDKPESSGAFLLDFPMRTDYMYGRMKRAPATELFALTVCLRLKAGPGPGAGTPFSYAVPGQANELVLIEWGADPMELLVNDEAATLPVTVSDGKWHHLCVTWATRDGAWEVYQDGARKGSGQNLAAWHAIKPGGMFLLGQEQDALGGRFDVTQSFTGQLADVHVWSRVLTPSEINGQATCGARQPGDVAAWEQEAVELRGGLTRFPFDPCH